MARVLRRFGSSPARALHPRRHCCAAARQFYFRRKQSLIINSPTRICNSPFWSRLHTPQPRAHMHSGTARESRWRPRKMRKRVVAVVAHPKSATLEKNISIAIRSRCDGEMLPTDSNACPINASAQWKLPPLLTFPAQCIPPAPSRGSRFAFVIITCNFCWRCGATLCDEPSSGAREFADECERFQVNRRAE